MFVTPKKVMADDSVRICDRREGVKVEGKGTARGHGARLQLHGSTSHLDDRGRRKRLGHSSTYGPFSQRLPVRLGQTQPLHFSTSPPLSRACLSSDGNFSGDRPPLHPPTLPYRRTPHPPTLPYRRTPHPPRPSSRASADLRGRRPGCSPYRHASLPRCVLCVKGMSASENQAAETSKGTDDMKVDRPWNIVHIRLPPKKRLPDASLILSKKVPRNNTESKEVPEPITGNLGKNLITAPVEGEANSHSPRAGLCNEAHSNIMSKTLSAESESDTSGNKLLDEVSTLSKNLRVAAEEQGSDAGSYAAKQGLCEETNNNNPSLALPLLDQELPEDNIDSSQSPRVGLCDVAISNILSQTQSAESQSNTSGDKLLNEANDCTLSKNLRVAAEEQGGDASSYAGLSDEANNIPSMTIPLPDQELPEDHIDNGRSKSLTTSGKQSMDEHNESPRKKMLYDTESKAEEEEGNYPSWNPTITTVKYEKMFAEANHPIPCKKLSGDAKNNRPSKRPADSANSRNESVYKRRRTSSVQATGTSQNTPGMKLSASVGQAVEQSTNAAKYQMYQEFDNKNKGTVYVDNLSPEAVWYG
uniref:Uncharacterized protein n=1 Tax=Avena sativa TaxID=4498 RepID=A0ACD5TAI4_AVESA